MELIDRDIWQLIQWTREADRGDRDPGHNVMKGYYKRDDATAEAISRNGSFRRGPGPA